MLVHLVLACTVSASVATTSDDSAAGAPLADASAEEAQPRR
jgi:hypothetical protein